MKVWKIFRDTFLANGLMFVGTYTGAGSSTIWTDSSLSLTASALIGGTAFVLYDAGGAGAAPEGEVKRISANSSTTITTTALTAALAAGDQFGYVSKEYRNEMLLPLMNIALGHIGRIGIQDTSITTAANQTEYTLPTAIKEGDIAGIYFQLETNDANDNRWWPLRTWQILPSTAGSTATLVLDQFQAGNKILIEYYGLHPTITAFSDSVHESIHPELARAALNYTLASRRSEGAIGSQAGFNQLYNKAAQEFEDAKRQYPVWLPQSRARRVSLDARVQDYFQSTVGSVRL